MALRKEPPLRVAVGEDFPVRRPSILREICVGLFVLLVGGVMLLAIERSTDHWSFDRENRRESTDTHSETLYPVRAVKPPPLEHTAPMEFAPPEEDKINNTPPPKTNG